MFNKILIANRAEIACRIIKTARRMGIRTVAVYSDVDAQARHVQEADEAVFIGAAPASESYLLVDKILMAAKETGCDAVHPGYGFLSENAEFADACAQAGVAFIGPPASAIRAMGLKSAAKSLMEKAGVPLTPGYHGDQQDPEYLAQQASVIGYPVLIKASAGGGGKGIRRVDDAADFGAALVSCQREADNAFGDRHVLIEKYVLNPRHIEVQIFADRHGHCVSLFERDCSVQRRHQKVLEEAPAPGMTDERRQAMGQAAINAAKAVAYVGAGTVEFICHADGRFYFMEMNTRLQVEHPVTEMIAGQDLVEWQLRVASGEPLPLKQAQLTLRGHALEARIYAEDPDNGFLPSTGRLVHLRVPEQNEHIRVDTGVDQGDDITPFYDPMIAKLIVWGVDREQALSRMRMALAQYQVVGVRSNVDFLTRLVSVRSFANADLDTGLIEREQEALFPPADEAPADLFLVAALAVLLGERRRAARNAELSIDPQSPWRLLDAWRLNGDADRRLIFRFDDVEQTVTVEVAQCGFFLGVAGQRIYAHGSLSPDGQLQMRLGSRQLRAGVVALGESHYVFLDGRCWKLSLIDPFRQANVDEESDASLRAPMPGKVIALLASPGKWVEKGDALIVMEAMKMEHTIHAPAAGTVMSLYFAVGDQVEDGAELLDFEASEETN